MEFSSPFMAKSPLHQGIEDKKPSVVETDASKEKRELSQKTKDSLQQKACKRDKPFYSKKHGKYVECEDGVLTNTPKNTSTYEKL
tara:strand:- start:1116 stop:1370 length:255 start_codon:yes stop_codon:yes gene_type:complete